MFQEPLYLDKCIVCCETDLEDYFEVQELSSKETFIFKVQSTRMRLSTFVGDFQIIMIL